jgi:hypothetical protein
MPWKATAPTETALSAVNGYKESSHVTQVATATPQPGEALLLSCPPPDSFVLTNFLALAAPARQAAHMADDIRLTLIEGGTRRSPSPRPRPVGPRTARVTRDGMTMKTITGVPVCYFDEVVVFADWRAARRGRSTG